MNKGERELLVKYLYIAEERLEGAVKDCSYRYTRRDLDSIDLLEEIIARTRLECFKDFSYDVRRLMKLDRVDSMNNQNIKLRNDTNDLDFYKSKIG